MRMKEGGKILEIEYTMTDPKMWKGEWKNTKLWLRMDYSDIPESEVPALTSTRTCPARRRVRLTSMRARRR